MSARVCACVGVCVCVCVCARGVCAVVVEAVLVEGGRGTVQARDRDEGGEGGGGGGGGGDACGVVVVAIPPSIRRRRRRCGGGGGGGRGGRRRRQQQRWGKAKGRGSGQSRGRAKPRQETKADGRRRRTGAQAHRRARAAQLARARARPTKQEQQQQQQQQQLGSVQPASLGRRQRDTGARQRSGPGQARPREGALPYGTARQEAGQRAKPNQVDLESKQGHSTAWPRPAHVVELMRDGEWQRERDGSGERASVTVAQLPATLTASLCGQARPAATHVSLHPAVLKDEGKKSTAERPGQAQPESDSASGPLATISGPGSPQPSPSLGGLPALLPSPPSVAAAMAQPATHRRPWQVGRPSELSMTTRSPHSAFEERPCFPSDASRAAWPGLAKAGRDALSHLMLLCAAAIMNTAGLE
ncbi:uncharacterized protein PSFLO_07682 [Pseudozyma flocculosa]|uniref:Uncharacterized protein n=1 Tax=Pseudozyma flocculosa TaxID=84751 RepID=A0A5C3FFS0_9BASI|nr:uncharacterized protein PSFLO_07682 [Pseudozyma flocculosa]